MQDSYLTCAMSLLALVAVHLLLSLTVRSAVIPALRPWMTRLAASEQFGVVLVSCVEKKNTEER